MKRRVVEVPFLRQLTVPLFLSALASSIPVFRIMSRWSVRIAADRACAACMAVLAWADGRELIAFLRSLVRISTPSTTAIGDSRDGNRGLIRQLVCAIQKKMPLRLAKYSSPFLLLTCVVSAVIYFSMGRTVRFFLEKLLEKLLQGGIY